MGMIDRHRDPNSEISKKYGSAQVRTLRAVYGSAFAGGYSPNAKLSEILVDLDRYWIQRLAEDHEAGTLTDKIEHHSKAPA